MDSISVTGIFFRASAVDRVQARWDLFLHYARARGEDTPENLVLWDQMMSEGLGSPSPFWVDIQPRTRRGTRPHVDPWLIIDLSNGRIYVSHGCDRGHIRLGSVGLAIDRPSLVNWLSENETIDLLIEMMPGRLDFNNNGYIDTSSATFSRKLRELPVWGSARGWMEYLGPEQVDAWENLSFDEVVASELQRALIQRNVVIDELEMWIWICRRMYRWSTFAQIELEDDEHEHRLRIVMRLDAEAQAAVPF